ncbi:hypothetical protein [Thermoflexus sp.]|uniref:hypothetical protein n=1 Tax=Thermoflexus sp. TaxID=1969742 RepID=UPI0035E44DA9
MGRTTRGPRSWHPKAWVEDGWSEAYRVLQDAVQIFIYESQRSGVGLIADLLRLGRRGWGWLLLLSAGMAVGLLLPTLGVSAQAVDLLAQPLGTGILALWVPFLWTLILTTFAALSPIARFLITLYSAYYFALPPIGAAGLEIAWIPLLTLFLYERAHPRSALADWRGRILWALALAQFPPHFEFPLPSAYRLSLSIALKTALGVGLAAIPLWPRARIPRMARGGFLWIGLTLPYEVAWGKDAAALFQGLQGWVAGLWGWSVPLWLWLGANLVEEGGRLGRFYGRRAEIFRRYPALLRSLPFVVLGLSVWMFLVLWPEVVREVLWERLGLVGERVLLFFIPLWRMVRSWPADLYLAARAATGAVLILGIAGIWMRRRMDPTRFGVQYLSLLIGTIAFLLMFGQSFFEAIDLDLPQQWWPWLMISLGWIWEPLKGIRELTEEAEDLLEAICALVLLLMTLVMARFLFDPEGLLREGAIWPLLGAAVWGFPLLVLTALEAALGVDGTGSPIRPFLLGYTLMVPLTSLLPIDTRWLTPMAFGLGSALLPTEGPQWARWLQRAWIGIGAVAFRVAPWIIPLPVLPMAGAGLERLFARGSLDFLSGEFFLLLGGALLAAIPATWREGRLGRWGGWLLGIGLWAAWNGVWRVG